jgi:hypothetical protein
VREPVTQIPDVEAFLALAPEELAAAAYLANMLLRIVDGGQRRARGA